jgi:hypothetical protein
MEVRVVDHPFGRASIDLERHVVEERPTGERF